MTYERKRAFSNSHKRDPDYNYNLSDIFNPQSCSMTEHSIQIKILDLLKCLTYDRAENVLNNVSNIINSQKETYQESNPIKSHIKYTREELWALQHKNTKCP